MPIIRTVNMDSPAVTNYLKGLGIMAVVFNHFANAYLSQEFRGYANGFIAIFFVLSGYGIFHSLSHEAPGDGVKLLVTFVKKRALRIYPLYWLWFLTHQYPDGVLGFFALNFIQPTYRWFVPAIVQCYIVAPIFYFLYHRFGAQKFFGAVVGVLTVLNAALFLAGYEPVRAVGYRGLFFLHIALFVLGFAVAALPDKAKTFRPTSVLVTFLLFAFFIHETSLHASFAFRGINKVFSLLFALSAFLFCLCFIRADIPLPLSRVFTFAGKYSFSIYLFNDISSSTLKKLHILATHQSGSPHDSYGLMVWLISLPFFIVLMGFMEAIIYESVVGERNYKRVFNGFLGSAGIKKVIA